MTARDVECFNPGDSLLNSTAQYAGCSCNGASGVETFGRDVGGLLVRGEIPRLRSE